MAERIGATAAAPPGRVTAFEVNGVRLAVANVDGAYSCFADACTHQGCALSERPLEGTAVTCACHGSRFDVTSGAVLHGPAQAPLRLIPVAVVGGELHATLAEKPPAPSPSASASPQTAATGGVGLAHIPLFAGIEPSAVAALEAFAFRRTFAQGAAIVEEGHTGNGVYVIVSGRVEVVRRREEESPQVVTSLGAGEPFGEMALLGEWKRTASVVAVEETTCIGLDRWIFLAHMRRDPEFAIRMLQVLAARLAEMNERVFGEN
jgi:nitrite reductase/ring-hydroxylating ferredoxin subunit